MKWPSAEYGSLSFQPIFRCVTEGEGGRTAAVPFPFESYLVAPSASRADRFRFIITEPALGQYCTKRRGDRGHHAISAPSRPAAIKLGRIGKACSKLARSVWRRPHASA